MCVMKFLAFLVPKTFAKVAYIAVIAVLAAIAFADPNWPVRCALVVVLIETLPGLLPVLPVFMSSVLTRGKSPELIMRNRFG
jgi:hypothetical protein